MMRSILFSALLLASAHAQAEWTKPENYEYDEPVIFNGWCQEMKDMYGPSCTCETNYGISNNIFSVDLDHEIRCDPLQGNTTCIDGITIESARVWLQATSIGNVDDFATIAETSITDFYVFMDDTDIGTISFRYNDGINTRRTGCEAVFGAINCNLCGLCDVPARNRSNPQDHLGPSDIFRGISGQCRYGNTGEGETNINVFNTCENGDNVLTRLLFHELEITSVNETGACPSNATIPPIEQPESASTRSTTILSVGLAVSSLLALWG